MEINNVTIAYFDKSVLVDSDVEGVCHKKAIPWLSVVQSVEGNYDIKIGSGKTYHGHCGPAGQLHSPCRSDSGTGGR